MLLLTFVLSKDAIVDERVHVAVVFANLSIKVDPYYPDSMAPLFHAQNDYVYST
jgi:hypothetical protein